MTKYTLQLNEFLFIFSKYGHKMSIVYNKEDQTYQAFFFVANLNTLCNLVTQRNKPRVFKSMKALLKAIPESDFDFSIC
jgi:hypothetical protein